jgi:hypothetical protein
MTNKTTTNLITCERCGEKRRPVVWRAIFCADCFEAIETEMNTPKPQAAVPAGFTRRDFRGDV